MLIMRNDNVVNMCEIKFYNEAFTVNRDYYNKLLHRQELLRAELTSKTTVHSTLISSFGLNYNEYSGIFDSCVSLDDLFV